mgnify:CR=1 FL=1
MLDHWNRVLVFAAHPDDEIIGCGGTIARLSAMGKRVFVVTFCAGETGYSTPEMKDKIAEMRRAEAEACNRVLGITERVILGKPTQGVVNDRETYQECVRLIRHYRPDVILTHWNEDKHRDHEHQHPQCSGHPSGSPSPCRCRHSSPHSRTHKPLLIGRSPFASPQGPPRPRITPESPCAAAPLRSGQRVPCRNPRPRPRTRPPGPTHWANSW